MEQICVLSFLGINSYLDLRKNQISLLLVLLYAVLDIPYLMVNRQRLILLLMGAVPGVLLLCIGKVFGDALGAGDGLVVLVSGLYMGIWGILGVLTLALILAAIWAVFLMVFRKKGGKSSFPFVPFLMAAYTIPWLIQVVEGVRG